ncbi:type II and III secretion system protein family protein [Plastoroseomonas hellenica]|uniref:type II and III secretion system protein family protein n=1 Tax=Plastoroseomonas hellenica TaxID=2687306 RepID=UPI001BAB3022|nr:type II and III secretion system protein family protein [Plastoroseomonas hellenica]MBR0647911.1 type II and III secretion system protein family protein [Plastoroseomonas hellenica]
MRGLLHAIAMVAMLISAEAALAQGSTGAAVSGGATNVGVGEGTILRMPRDITQVFIADQAVADVQIVSPRVVYVYGRRIGQTSLHAVDGSSGVVAQFQVRVERSAAAARNALPTRRSGVDMEFVGDRLMTQGRVGSVGEAMEVEATARAYSPEGQVPLDRTRLGGSQHVALRVRFAEVSRNDLERLGVNWQALLNPGNFAFRVVTGGFMQGFNPAEAFGSIGGGFNDGSNSVDLLVDALRREGVLSLLAEPTLTAFSGERARFLAGGEVPIPVPVREGIVGIEYKRFGVMLDFTPTILPEGRIGLRVRPEVSEMVDTGSLTIQGYRVPSFTTRFAETTVELGSGQTLAIAGLFQRRMSDNTDRLPGIGSLPILGALFRSTRFQRSETELVILITPILSQAVRDPTAIPTPIAPARAALRREQGLVGFVVD